jgi:hypothetical protein
MVIVAPAGKVSPVIASVSVKLGLCPLTSTALGAMDLARDRPPPDTTLKAFCATLAGGPGLDAATGPPPSERPMNLTLKLLVAPTPPGSTARAGQCLRGTGCAGQGAGCRQWRRDLQLRRYADAHGFRAAAGKPDVVGGRGDGLAAADPGGKFDGVDCQRSLRAQGGNGQGQGQGQGQPGPERCRAPAWTPGGTGPNGCANRWGTVPERQIHASLWRLNGHWQLGTAIRTRCWFVSSVHPLCFVTAQQQSPCGA